VSQPYLSLEAELHDAFWQAEDDESEVPLIAGFLESHPGCALEVGAGAGRLMFPLIQMGYEVEGLELSPDMLAIGRKRAKSMSLEAVLHQGDMTTWTGDKPYSAILAPAFTLQLADDPEAALRHWHSLLEPHGGLYLTVFMPYAELLGDLTENAWYPDHRATLPDGRIATLETRHRIDHPHQQLHREHRYEISGSPPVTHESKQTIRWLEHSQMIEMLKKTGFEPTHHCLDFDLEHAPNDPDSENFDGILTYFAHRADTPT
jgi:SAM-dependent methyltransferase